MKKIYLFAVVTAIALAACTKTETTGVSEGNLIKFDNAFVGNPTKANPTIIDESSIKEFYVYASKDDDNSFFENERVYSNSGSWIYDELKQWESGSAYKFAAYSNGGTAENAGKLDNVVWNGTKLTISEYEASDKDLVASISATDLSSINNPVAFSFSHALAMVKFTIKSELGDIMKISSFKVTGLKSKATLEFDSSAATWSNHNSDRVLNSDAFEAIVETPGVSDEFIVIPQDGVTLTVTFDAEFDGLQKKSLTATIANTSWDPGFRYNYVATVTGADMDIISFADPLVKDWDDTSWDNPIEGGDVVQQ